MLKIEWTDELTNDEVYQRAEKERLFLKLKKNKIDANHGQGIQSVITSLQ